MTFPLWTHYIIGGNVRDDDKYTYAVIFLALVFPILAFLRNATMNEILIRGMLAFLLVLIGDTNPIDCNQYHTLFLQRSHDLCRAHNGVGNVCYSNHYDRYECKGASHLANGTFNGFL